MRISDWSSDVCSSDLKPGAVHIELPEDIADEHTDSTPLKRSHSRRPTADVKSIREAVKALEKATSPVLVIGAGANRTMTGRMLLQFIENTGIPFITTQLGKGVIDERSEKHTYEPKSLMSSTYALFLSQTNIIIRR